MIRVRLEHETVLGVVLVVMMVLVGLMNPAFVSRANLYDLLKSSTVLGLFALGVLLVLISGGIDISFTAIAAFAMYGTGRILVSIQYEGGALPAFALAAFLGFGLGMLNALFIATFRLPTLIVTLGTAGLIRGALLAFVGTEILNNLPPGLVRLSRQLLFRQTLEGGETAGLSPLVLVWIAAALGIAGMLRHTMLGRGWYALGGNTIAAERCGFRVTTLHYALYSAVGALAGVAGLIHAITMRNANPFDLVGTELTVIAAVVLGGASIFGGRGTVRGTVLGVLLLAVVNNSLILLGIPSYWERVFAGAILLVSTGVSARAQRTRRRLP